MQILRVKVFRETWLLGDPRSLWIYESSCVATTAIADVRAVLACIDRSALARVLHMERCSSYDLERALIDRIQSGSLRLLRENRSTVQTDSGVRLEPSALEPKPKAQPHPPPKPKPKPVPDDPRALLITRCDGLLGTEGPLTFSYLIRGLAGRPSTLRIRSPKYAGEVLHELALPPADTIDKVHDQSWDGVVTVGIHAGKRVSPAFGPCTLEIVHDSTYRGTAEFALLDRQVVIVEIGGFSFHTDREILLPDVEPLAVEEPGPARVSGIVAAAAVLRFAAENPKKKLFVAGHTDTVGKQKDNLTLSTDRARNVQLYLAGDADAWAEHCQAHHEVEDIQRILAWVSATFPEYACDPGSIDNDLGPKTQQARDAFRAKFEELTGESIPAMSKQAPRDWKAYFQIFDRAVHLLLDHEGLDLGRVRESLSFTNPAHAGFGESFPTDRPDVDKLDSERNRRVEVVFLDPSEAELVSDTTGEPLYGPEAGIVRKYIPLGFAAAHDEIAFRLVDQYDNPLPDVLLELLTPEGTTRTARTDVGGTFVFPKLARGTCSLCLPEVDATAWSSIEVADRKLPTPPGEIDPDLLEPEPVTKPFDATTKAQVLDDDPWDDE